MFKDVNVVREISYDVYVILAGLREVCNAMLGVKYSIVQKVA